jgi:hypothetical protein
MDGATHRGVLLRNINDGITHHGVLLRNINDGVTHRGVLFRSLRWRHSPWHSLTQY